MLQTNALPRIRPEEAGVSPSAISSFLKEAQSSNIGLHSFLLLRHGHVAAEACWAPYNPDYPRMMFSLSKSFTSTAVGFAVAEGLLSVDDPVISFFPDKHPIDDEHLKAMRVRHLLTMSTGHAKDTTGQLHKHPDKDWVQAFLELPVEHKPGTHFVYNSGATYMLSAIVQTITGQTLVDYLQPRLFEPLGIQGAKWDSCPRNINTGGWGLKIKPADIALFGQMYLQKGMWNGTQVVPEAWVDEATSFQVSNGEDPGSDWKQGYGYQFWRCRHGAYRGDGAFGQFCLVMPEQDTVIAITSGVKNMQSVLNLVWEHLLPGISEQPLPLDEVQYDELQDAIASLGYAPLAAEFTSSEAESITGNRYIMEDNELKLQSASFRFEEAVCTFDFQLEPLGNGQIQCGIGSWIESTTIPIGGMSGVAASGKWSDDSTFVMEWRFVETPFYYTLTCRFEENSVKMEIISHIGGSNEPLHLIGQSE
ncbi:class C beta-lactamase-related serine hydrolase [Paenibacillus sp. H1-7]|uniref:serine hydrolase domain-containing protein n=1 Tax=Paenibacillus sp. H1-7 TaxID=2282849 RepID=UPI001EF85A3D|nr:serine hydrolase [Paenibacillus sp. H1-7]ULL17078.1 class C beta-lactamase-related serine hydrolase [Paenibacillus sp. H1-7]